MPRSNSFRSTVFLFFILDALVLGVVPTAQASQAALVTLQSQVKIERRNTRLGAADWAWLRNKQRLVLGVSAPSNPPLDFACGSTGYEGITADVMALLQQELNIAVSVRCLPDRAHALQALEAGEIDLLGTTTETDQSQWPLRLSQPYASSRSILLKRQGDTRALKEGMKGLTIAYVQDYLDKRQVLQHFPQAHLQHFKSATEALEALAFGTADAYLGDLISSHYLINRSFFNYVTFERFVELGFGGFSFAMRQNDTQLARIVNTTLSAMGQPQLSRIIKRWSGGGLVLPDDRIAFSPQETRWLSRNPEVTLIVNDDLAPVAFFDADGHFNGVIDDLLTIITQHTGIQFKVERSGGSLDTLQQALINRQADLAILSPATEREAKLRFTIPFHTTSLAIMTRRAQGADHRNLESLQGKHLAIAKGNIALQGIRADFPRIKILEPSSALDAMKMVADGQADAALVALTVARYYQARLYEKQLKISGLSNYDAVIASFAMRRSDTELQSILNKAIRSIPPHELNSITSRWRANAAMSGQTWRDYRTVIAGIITSAFVLLALFLAWVFHLRRQISRRVAAERQLSDQLQFIMTLWDAIPQPIYVRDLEGRLVSCTRSYEVALGIVASDALGKTAMEMPTSGFQSAPHFHANYLQALALEQPIAQRCQVPLGNQEVWIDHWIQPFRDSTGNLKGIICGWTDITAQQQLIEKLKNAKNLADAASRAKTTFLTTMSHEIRTPMNAVIGTLELALKRADSGHFDRDGIEIAYSSAHNLLELIGDILDIVKIESGHLSLSPKRANLRELVGSVTRVFEGLARQKGLSLALEMGSNINCDVQIDPLRFKQVLSNLLSNAIKFTPKGFVKIRIEGEHLDDTQVLIRLEVSDTGIGISAQDQQQLFRPFAQVAQPEQHFVGGTGLGLVISRTLCEMMGGTLKMSSVQSQGTRIDIQMALQTLPLISCAPPPAPDITTQPKAIPRLRVLIVDDHAVNRKVLREQLDYLKHEAIEAHNGVEALEQWRAMSFDAVITDCHMPELDGVGLTQAIRHEERLRGLEPCLVLGLTADAQAEQIEQGILSGMNDCLLKPMGLESLDEQLRAFGFGAGTIDPSRQGSRNHDSSNPDSGLTRDVVSALEKLVGKEPTIIGGLINNFLSSNRDDLHILRALRHAQDNRALAELAHKIRGAAQVMGGQRLIECCKQLESACSQHPITTERVNDSARDVEVAILELERALSEIKHT